MKKDIPSLRKIFHNDWVVIFFGCLLNLILILWLGFHFHFFYFNIPLNYSGDSIFTLSVIQKLQEGWIYKNSRMAFPFDSYFLDFPLAEFGQLVFLKIIVMFTMNNAFAYNAFYCLSFILCFLTSYISLKFFKFNTLVSFMGATLYAFVPFHFSRIDHLFYTMYFCVPLYILIAYKYYMTNTFKTRTIFFYIFGLILLATTGVYYALFGLITITTSIIAKAIKTLSFKFITIGFLLNISILLGIVFSTLPNIIHKFNDLPNPNAVQRSPVESEIYGFKMVQLLLPQTRHHSNRLRILRERYDNSYPLNNENGTSSLGLIASIGFILSLTSIVFKILNKPLDSRIEFFSLLTFIYFLFGTIGGLGVIFSSFVTPLIRCWNRISIFINFTTIVIVFLYLQNFYYDLERKYKFRLIKSLTVFLAFCIPPIGGYDQIPYGFYSNIKQISTYFLMEKDFIENIEKNIAPYSPIYQLPYMQFPEVPPTYYLDSYEPLKGFIHSKTLKWSFGGMKGREGDLFFQNLSKKPTIDQIKTISKMGFKGIYVDLRGYEDHGIKIINELEKILGKPLLIRNDKNIYFFKIKN